MFFLIVSTFKAKINFKDKKLIFLIAINIVPIILMFLTSLFMGIKIRTMWMTPFYLFIGVLFVYIFQKKIAFKKLKYFILYFDKTDNFKKVLFRPGFAIQARELTQLQSNLQNQIEQHSNHIFKEGAMVIPGQLSLNLRFYTLKLASTFGGETLNPSQYYNATTPVTITGATTGVKAKVIGYAAASTTDQPLLYLIYEDAGSDYSTSVFSCRCLSIMLVRIADSLSVQERKR